MGKHDLIERLKRYINEVERRLVDSEENERALDEFDDSRNHYRGRSHAYSTDVVRFYALIPELKPEKDRTPPPDYHKH